MLGAQAKLSILLADEDALRRDGLSAVLSGNSGFSIVAGVPDGDSALASIRELRPDVAVVDLNLPRVHGIELVRRLRAESLPTKVIIFASTDNDDIVREVVRAGADGYLLKNGPSRHLIDAILYVRDGGQYFSPQLKRDGLDRRLLEEPARVPPPPAREAPRPEPVSRHDEEDPESEEEYRPRTRPARRPESANFRQRLREDASASNLKDRDYEIMSMMADGIRPILDRLEEIDTRVAMMESGDVEVPGDPRTWLNTQLVQTVDPRADRMGMTYRGVDDLEARLPQLIEDAVTKRFSQMAGKLQQEIEETHVKTLESFVKNIQVKLVQRVTALEHDMSRQADAMRQITENSMRTEANLGRLIDGVDKLAQDLPRRLAASNQTAQSDRAQSEETGSPAALEDGLKPAPRRIRRRSSGNGMPLPKMIGAGVVGLLLFALIGWGIVKLVVEPPDSASEAPAADPLAAQTDGKSKGNKVSLPAGAVDTKTKIQAAQEAMDHKDYAVAEDVYRTVLRTEPNNVEAIKGLASVLFREDKTEEAAAILDKLPKD